MRWLTCCLLALGTLAAQGTKPKPNPADYDAWINAGPVDIGAEYMVHSFSNTEDSFLASNFLVVEVAFYPPMKDQEFKVDLKKFALRLNNKTLIPVVPPSQAAAGLRMPAWSQGQGGLSGGVGVGPIGIPVGGQNPYPQQRMPNPPRTPESDPSSGVEHKKATPEEVLMQTALTDGPHKGPSSGFVYFPFTGKPSSLKTVELVYGEVNLKIK